MQEHIESLQKEITDTREENLEIEDRTISVMGKIEETETALAEEKENYATLKEQYAQQIAEKVATLSGGEQQRVSVARVLAQETDFIFLDEPSSHLDIHHKFALMELLGSLAQKGKGIAAVLHDLDLASRFCDRVLVLEDGRTRALGEPSQVFSEKLLSSVFKVRGSWDPQSGNLLVFR